MSISGKFLTSMVNGDEVVDNYAWTAEGTGDVLDRTVGSDNGAEREDMGVEGLHVTIKGYADITQVSFADLRRGSIVTDVQLFRSNTDATPAYTISEALVVRDRQGGEIRGKMEFEIEIHSRGDVVTYSDPS